MEDKELMQNILLLEKGVADLYLHGAIEASSPDVNKAFLGALNDTLTMQDEVYQQMSAKGWYQTEQAEQDKIDTLKQKFSNMSQQA